MILITRPQKQAQKTQKILQADGFKCKIFPLLKIEYFWDVLANVKDYQNVIVTSIHAAKVLVKSSRFMQAKFYVVGNKVSTYLLNYGYKVTGVAATAAELVVPNHSTIHISGDYIAHDFGYERIVVYKSIAVTASPKDLLSDVETILFYSPRTARAFRNLMPKLNNISAICISFNTALPLKSLNFKQILIAENPTEKSMLKLLNAQ